MLRRDGDALRCVAASDTALHGRRGPAAVEATAVAALVALRLRRPDVLPAKPLLAALARDRQTDGTWGTTQATVLALRAVLAAGEPAGPGTTTVTLRSRGRERRVELSIRRYERDQEKELLRKYSGRDSKLTLGETTGWQKEDQEKS